MQSNSKSVSWNVEVPTDFYTNQSAYPALQHCLLCWKHPCFCLYKQLCPQLLFIYLLPSFNCFGGLVFEYLPTHCWHFVRGIYNTIHKNHITSCSQQESCRVNINFCWFICMSTPKHQAQHIRCCTLSFGVFMHWIQN